MAEDPVPRTWTNVVSFDDEKGPRFSALHMSRQTLHVKEHFGDPQAIDTVLKGVCLDQRQTGRYYGRALAASDAVLDLDCVYDRPATRHKAHGWLTNHADPGLQAVVKDQRQRQQVSMTTPCRSEARRGIGPIRS